MGVIWRKLTLEFKKEAVHRVIDAGRSLTWWVRDERRRLDTVTVSFDVSLTAAERTELMRLRRQVAQMDKDLGLWRNPNYMETVTRTLCLTQIGRRFSP